MCQVTIQQWVLLLEYLCLIEWVILGVIYYILSGNMMLILQILSLKCVYDTGQDNAQILSYYHIAAFVQLLHVLKIKRYVPWWYTDQH